MIFAPSLVKRRLFFIFFDVGITAFSVWLAYALRFDFEIETQYAQGMIIALVFLMTVRLAAFYGWHVYDISWRHFGFKDATKLTLILMATTALFTLLALMLRGSITIPRSIIPMEFFITLVLMLALRMSKRFLLEAKHRNAVGAYVVIIASPDNANTILRTIDKPQSPYYPIAILHDTYHGMKIHNVRVLSYEAFDRSNLEASIAIVDETIDIKPLYERLRARGVKEIKVATAYSDYEAKLHEISVEDLLARHPKDLDKTLIGGFIRDKKVLITGAGGSIGSEIARQCAAFGASQLILLDHSEYNLYAIAEELHAHNPVLVMQSVVDRTRLEATFTAHKPDIVIHAAAYKHVPLVEANIREAVANNVLGTKNTIDCAIAHGVEKFVLISTDKAVRPTNVMGTTKRICELYAQNTPPMQTEIVAVRFGNVLGSSGSVIPKFKAQIATGGPITVTHPDITRYFMLIPEACELVLQAAAIGQGGEIFILDMGEPIKIVDLAQKMIELSGKPEIEIKFTGLRPGEKLYEELLIDESDQKTAYPSITVAGRTAYEIDTLNADIDILLKTPDVLAQLKTMVPEFEHKI